MLCERCHKNIAVVFIRDKNDASLNKQLCMSCAKALGHEAMPDLMKSMGITEEMFDELNMQLTENPPEISPEMVKEAMGMFSAIIPEYQGVDADEDSDDDGDDEGDDDAASVLTFPLKPASGDDDAERTTREQRHARRRARKSTGRKMMDQYCVNLTDKAANGEIDRLIGRERELARVTQILNRRNKNNPVLIGEPGVGKTAIAEGLALRIVQGDVPEKLADKEIHLLDMSTLVAGTQFRGQFEARLKNIIEEAKAAGNIIFVIDEVHTIVSAGDAEGAIAAGNILKPALAKGQIQIIGATTLTEYRKSIEKDAALERRFQPVMVDEPSLDETVEIIKGIRDYYEGYHSVRIGDECIRYAVNMSKRYIQGRFLPDKAIDLLDEAASGLNLRSPDIIRRLRIEEELSRISDDMESLEHVDTIEAYSKLAELRTHSIRLGDELVQVVERCNNIALSFDDIARVIELWTKIPVATISQMEQTQLLGLSERLRGKIKGQDTAVDAVSRAVMVGRVGLSRKPRPVSFIFVGPTGVGKTELVKQLCMQVFGSLDALVRLDMSEYMEKHTVSKLIGSPPGYVGYDDAGQLTEKIRRHPYSLILFDEIEKAHYDIFNILLQILDDGRITDNTGRTVSFANCIIVMTSNAGSDENNNALGFTTSANEAVKSKMESALKKLFRPEFLGRVDEVVYFDMLTNKELTEIAGIMLDELSEGLSDKGITAQYTDALRAHIVDKGYDQKYGARPMRRLIHREIETAIAAAYINGSIADGSCITVDYVNGNVAIS